MKVALYYPWIYLTGGAERVITELTGRSRHDWTIFTSHYEPESTFPALRERNIVELPRVSVTRDMKSVGVAAWRILQQRLPVSDFDALFVMCEGLGDLVVFRNCDRPVVCYCLTPLRIAFDEVYQQRHLQHAGGLGKLLLKWGSGLFRLLDRFAWTHYDHVFFISREAARRAVSGKLIRQGRVEVLYPASGLQNDKPSSVREPMFVMPGRIMWTKNLELGIKAFLRFLVENPDLSHYRLVVAGMVDKKSETYLETLRSLAGGCPNVEFKVNPSDADLHDLYRTCSGVLFTPLNEDWGIIPLESMSFGKPVISVNRGGPLESISDGVDGFLVPPSPDLFAQKMAYIARNPEAAAAMGTAGFRKSRRITWDSLVDRIDDQLDQVVRAAQGEYPSPLTMPELVIKHRETRTTAVG